MTNRTIYGETWTPEDRRNVLRLASWCDGLPSYRVDFDINGNPLLSHGKEHVKASEYLPTGGITASFLEARGWSGRESLYGVLTCTDVRGVVWDAVPGPRNQRVKFSFRHKENPYKRSALISLGRQGYFALFDGYGSVPAALRIHLVQLGYTPELDSTPQAAGCKALNSAKH